MNIVPVDWKTVLKFRQGTSNWVKKGTDSYKTHKALSLQQVIFPEALKI